jgi:hypothetical protein
MNSFFNPADKLSERRAEMDRAETDIYTIHSEMMKNTYFLCVDYEERDLAKKHKCKFDRDLKLWYCEDKTNPMMKTHARVYLYFQFKDKDIYKSLGAKYDPLEKEWYGKIGNLPLMDYYRDFKEQQEKKREEESEHYRKNKTYH